MWSISQEAHQGRLCICLQGSTLTAEEFDAVVIAIGNYHEPNLVTHLSPYIYTVPDVRQIPRHICRPSRHNRCVQPDVAGMDSFPGRQLHCHNFRHNEAFRDQRVLVVGASFSGKWSRSCCLTA